MTAKKFPTKKQKKQLWRLLALVLVLAFSALIYRFADPKGFSALFAGQEKVTEAAQSSRSAGSSFAVHMIDIGIGDSCLVQCDGKAMLIDAGENDAGDEVLSYLAAQGVTKLDVAVGTHAHSDHIGGLDTVLRAMPCDEVLLSEMAKSAVPTTKTYTDLLRVIADKKIPLVKAKAGNSFSLGSATVEILGPVKLYDELNNTSVVLRIVYGDTAFLFTGDMEQAAEKDLLASGCMLRADVLKVGHHGSSTATSTKFLNAVAPSYALISVNANNPYGHPHKETMAKLSKAGVQSYLTRDSGSIVIRSDGKKLTITEEK